VQKISHKLKKTGNKNKKGGDEYGIKLIGGSNILPPI